MHMSQGRHTKGRVPEEPENDITYLGSADKSREIRNFRHFLTIDSSVRLGYCAGIFSYPRLLLLFFKGVV